MTLVGIAVVALMGSGSLHARVIQSVRADLDRDGRMETVAITRTGAVDGHPTGGDTVVMRGEKVLWRQACLNPWKVTTGDVDGDGKPEIIAGVWKKSPRDPVMAKRTFVYSWNGRRMLPKWLGSRLSRRFDDFVVADINGDRMAELISLELAPEGKRRVSVYRWFSFGFEFLGCSEDMAGLRSLRVESHDVTVIGRNERYALSLSNGCVTLAKGGHAR